jgi:hypothetical protein
MKGRVNSGNRSSGSESCIKLIIMKIEFGYKERIYVTEGRKDCQVLAVQ